MAEQGGTHANFTGNQLENFIEFILVKKGYKFIHKKKFDVACYIGQPIYSKQFFIGKSIYETNSYCDFILYHPKKHTKKLIIESKWQQSAGSVDEKYPYLILNIQMKYPCKSILLLDGGGYKKGAEDWIRSQIGNNLVNVFNMSEFQKWSNKGNL